jgi:DNA polymerase III subunit delta
VRLKPEQFAGLAKAPPPELRAVLLFGADAGLIRERATLLTRAAAGDDADPFRVAEFTADALLADRPRLSDEVRALSLVGGRRVVRVRGAGNAFAPLLEDVLEDPTGPGALVVIEAAGLNARDRLTKLCEEHEAAAATPCQPDEGEDLEALVLGILHARKIAIEPPALEVAVERLGADRLASRGEVEKLALYKGAGAGPITMEDVEAVIGDGAAVTLEDAVFAAASGDQAGLDRILPKRLAAGDNPVQIVRAMLRHVQRLHLAASLASRGQPPEQAMRALRPPVFYKRLPAFRAQLRQWAPERLVQAMELLTQAELDCKSTGMPAETICARTLMRVAQAARAGLSR